jgi:hypothetical protein
MTLVNKGFRRIWKRKLFETCAPYLSDGAWALLHGLLDYVLGAAVHSAVLEIVRLLAAELSARRNRVILAATPSHLREKLLY